MANDDDCSDQERRIERLKAQAAAASGGRMVCSEDTGMDSDLREKFWRRVVSYEENDATTDLVKELTAIGVPLPDPDGLDERTLHTALWNVINGLDRLHVFLEFTDHLSDRELYTKLVREILPEEMDAIDPDDGAAWHIPVLGCGTPEDLALYLKYFADERAREMWRKDLPDTEIPEHVDPPYARDSELPRPPWM